jgi:hypothetical protein
MIIVVDLKKKIHHPVKRLEITIISVDHDKIV